MSSGPWSIIDGLSFRCFFVNIISWVLGHLWGPNPAFSCSSMFLFSRVRILLLLTHPTKASFLHTCTYLHERKREEKINEVKKRDKFNTFWKPMVFIHPFFNQFGSRHVHAARSVASVTSSSLWPHGLRSARFLCPWNSSQFKDWTWVSCIAGRFFTIWACFYTSQQILLLSSSFSFIKFSTPFSPNMWKFMWHLCTCHSTSENQWLSTE